LEKFISAHVAEAHVENHRAVSALRQGSQGSRARAHTAHLIAVETKSAGQRTDESLVIIDEQDRSRGNLRFVHTSGSNPSRKPTRRIETASSQGHFIRAPRHLHEQSDRETGGNAAHTSTLAVSAAKRSVSPTFYTRTRAFAARPTQLS